MNKGLINKVNPNSLMHCPLEYTTNDISRNLNNIVINGTLNYIALPGTPAGKYSIGRFTDVNYLSAKSSVVSTMQGSQNWKITGMLYAENFANLDPAIIELYGSGASNIWVQVTGGTAIRLGKNGGVAADSSTGFILPLNWYIYELIGTKTNLIFRIRKTNSSIWNTLTAVTDGTVPSISSINWGRLVLAPGRTMLNGFQKEIQIIRYF